MRLAVAGVALCLLAAAIGSGPAGAAQPAISITPAQSLPDDPLAIRVTHLAPGPATVGISSTDAAGYAWASSASFGVRAGGTLDLATATARSGSYRGVWPTGLFVTMKPTRRDPAGAYAWT